MFMPSKNNICKELLNLITDYTEIENSITCINPVLVNTTKEVLIACRQHEINETDKLKIESVIDYIHEELHTGPWKCVPISIRRAFTSTSFLKAVVLLHFSTSAHTLSEAMRSVDLGILLGAPLPMNDELLNNSVKIIDNAIASTGNVHLNKNLKRKRKLEDDSLEFDKINAVQVEHCILPSLECFSKNFFHPQIPCVIQDSINHWPALRKWMDINYLLKVAGERTVPIEIGSQYSDENWSQKLMVFKDFIEKYYLEGDGETGYLAQHNLLDQIPELKNDICTPEYCCVSRNSADDSSTIEINAWLGPKGTVSSLHFDPKDNLLAQIYGTKLVLMFSPEDSKYLYTHESQMLCNTSKINPLNPLLDQFPEFRKAKMFKCLLKPGEMLYMPPEWWHHIIALERSFSVNFWWS